MLLTLLYLSRQPMNNSNFSLSLNNQQQCYLSPALSLICCNDNNTLFLPLSHSLTDNQQQFSLVLFLSLEFEARTGFDIESLVRLCWQENVGASHWQRQQLTNNSLTFFLITTNSLHAHYILTPRNKLILLPTQYQILCTCHSHRQKVGSCMTCRGCK